jgi:putative peptidoglycan binding protein
MQGQSDVQRNRSNDGNRDWSNHNGSGHRWSGGDHQGRHHHWDRSRHDRSWWSSRYSRFALFGGGYYYWNGGYWYPAYGYDPYFSTYSYDAPIYAYNDMDPGDVIANAQTELQRLGYDPGAVDGTFGPRTRAAVLDFQRDNGLPVSGEIDEATLDALGLN